MLNATNKTTDQCLSEFQAYIGAAALGTLEMDSLFLIQDLLLCIIIPL